MQHVTDDLEEVTATRDERSAASVVNGLEAVPLGGQPLTPRLVLPSPVEVGVAPASGPGHYVPDRLNSLGLLLVRQ